ncbi:hypothetical protein BU17DRAFT_38620 [Hysterangium stoloniferum]|nr:hypothetical protein BU17DRAFT_38620 [Hysterangium stoloniferum]
MTSNALESLSALLTSLSEAPYDLGLHAKHIQLASSPDLEEQFDDATQLLLNFYAATDQVWLPFLQTKMQRINIPYDFDNQQESELDLKDVSLEVLLDLLDSFRKAANDYLSISILKSEIQLLTLLHSSASSNPELEPLLSEDAVRSAISTAALGGSWHMTQGHVLWDLQVAWELARLEEKAPGSVEREIMMAHVESLHLDRLKQPHSHNEETLQSYSSFVSKYYNPSEYETRLVAASQLRNGPAKAWSYKERYEMGLACILIILMIYESYIFSERRVKAPSVMLISALHERAIEDFAKRRWEALLRDSEAEVKKALENDLRFFWSSYINSMAVQRALEHHERELSIAQRAVRSVPGSGEIWAKFVRALERGENDIVDDNGAPAPEQESVTDIFARAMSTSLLQASMEQMLPLFTAVAGYQKRHLKERPMLSDAETFEILVNTLETGMTLIRKASKEGDPYLTLENFLAGVYMSLETPLSERAIALWKSTAKHYKTSYLAWSKYAGLLISENEYTTARALFEDISPKKIDWPEAIWKQWIEFEQLHGTLDDIESCLEKVEKLSTKAEKQRAKVCGHPMSLEMCLNVLLQEAAETRQAWIDAAQLGEDQQKEQTITQPSEQMVVDSTGDRKRKAEESDTATQASKRVKLGTSYSIVRLIGLFRDRENSTVFVAGLVPGITDDDLRTLFKDCGAIREIKITPLDRSVVATVEFMDRESIPPALTKDKKRLEDAEIMVHLAWKSTLYVTNFPEASDDEAVRKLFGTYGEIFDVRWPSKKYKSTRRFCYVQYTDPTSASAALSLNNCEMEPGRKLAVYISNPERKQERSDAAANQREIYVAGLARSVTEADIRNLFGTFGLISAIRLPQDEKGVPKGFGFIEFNDMESANAALSLNNYELKRRRLAVTLADTRAQPRQTDTHARRSRTLRVKNLPAGTQEGLLQQALEKHAKVVRIEIFHRKNEAIVEMDSAAEAGRLLLKPEPIIFGDQELQLIEEDLPASSRVSTVASPMFVPRGAGRPRAGLGSKRQTTDLNKSTHVTVATSSAPPGNGKGQDDFRRMLNHDT